jgi:hypothetical protein
VKEGTRLLLARLVLLAIFGLVFVAGPLGLSTCRSERR